MTKFTSLYNCYPGGTGTRLGLWLQLGLSKRRTGRCRKEQWPPNRTQKLQRQQPKMLILTARMLGLVQDNHQIHATADRSESTQATGAELWFHIVTYSSGKGKADVVLISCNYSSESDIPEQNIEVPRALLAWLYLPFQNSSPLFLWRLPSLCFPWTEASSTDVSLHRPSRRSTIWQEKMGTLNQDSRVRILALALMSCVSLKK